MVCLIRASPKKPIWRSGILHNNTGQRLFPESSDRIPTLVPTSRTLCKHFYQWGLCLNRETDSKER